MNLRKELRDQGAHFAAALLALLPLTPFVSCSPVTVAAFAWTGFCMGVVRELTEEGEVSLPALKRALGSRLDLTFWTLGGATAGAVGCLLAALLP